MNVIPPIAINAAKLTSTTATEAYAAYAVGTTYALAARVIDATGQWVYESLAASNLGNALTNTAKWFRVGPSNKYAMFDLLRNTATVMPSTLTVAITPGERVNSLMLSAMVANALTLWVTSGATTVYSLTKDLNKRIVVDWYDYYFAAFDTQPSLAVFDLPPYTDAVIHLTLTGAGNVECGACLIGNAVDIGDVQYEAESDTLNFSTVTRDFAGGTAEMIPKRNVPRTVQSIVVDKAKVNKVRALRDALAGAPAAWSGLIESGDGYFEAMLIVGFYKRFSINLKHPQHAIISLELEEI